MGLKIKLMMLNTSDKIAISKNSKSGSGLLT